MPQSVSLILFLLLALPGPLPAHAAPAPGSAPTYTYEIVRTYPHDETAYTQGLIYEDGILYEGTGLWGDSSLRKMWLDTGAVIQAIELDDQYFGEGVTVWGERIIQLTYTAGTGFVYGKDDFDLQETFAYTHQGWGLTHDGEQLIVSDGTATLHFLDPDTLTETGQVEVSNGSGPQYYLNELEYIDGLVYANIYGAMTIAVIDPVTGLVTAWIDLTGILDNPPGVLNGIAYDGAGDRLFVTGKYWPLIFEIDLVPLTPRPKDEPIGPASPMEAGIMPGSGTAIRNCGAITRFTATGGAESRKSSRNFCQPK